MSLAWKRWRLTHEDNRIDEAELESASRGDERNDSGLKRSEESLHLHPHRAKRSAAPAAEVEKSGESPETPEDSLK